VFFQLPVLPELVLSSFHFRLLTHAAARSNTEREVYEEALSQPGGLTSALNYYRAATRSRATRPAATRATHIETPTLVLWGERDRFLDLRVLDGIERYVTNIEIVRFRDTGHWPHIDAAARVNAEILQFLAR
jgi:pimeloyl-ACP methyl ester carboxylesterase